MGVAKRDGSEKLHILKGKWNEPVIKKSSFEDVD